ncbi:hypothetical protein CHELA40_11752 [Chelatococcus asaccharovorans]|nr:hypothetical protein CHELA40_11752 [Chelatococcus asaccharovorans]CAH1684137.1 hypothetical protein CHELA17_63849 [Chelatococcus asaccharovorans]
MSGELSPIPCHWSIVLREGRAKAWTRKPGDLPRPDNVPGRGVPVVRLQARRRLPVTGLFACRSAFAPNIWVQADVFQIDVFTISRHQHAWHAADGSAP